MVWGSVTTASSDGCRSYTGPTRRGKLRELTPEQVWGAVQFLGIENGGSWYSLSRRQLTRRIGVEYPFAAERTRGSAARD
jgi:hypothetical protein